MDKKRFFILLLGILPCFITASLADTDTDTAVVTFLYYRIEGKILEKTDNYIKMDFQGLPIIIYTDEIDGMHEYKTVSHAANKGVNQKDDIASFRNWFTTKEVSGYLNSIYSLVSKNKKELKQWRVSFDEAWMKKEETRKEKLLAEGATMLSAVIADLRSLNPPIEFEGHRNKLIELYDNMKMSIDASIIKDKDSSNKYFSKAVYPLGVEASRMLTSIFDNHQPSLEIKIGLEYRNILFSRVAYFCFSQLDPEIEKRGYKINNVPGVVLIKKQYKSLKEVIESKDYRNYPTEESSMPAGRYILKDKYCYSTDEDGTEYLNPSTKNRLKLDISEGGGYASCEQATFYLWMDHKEKIFWINDYQAGEGKINTSWYGPFSILADSKK